MAGFILLSDQYNNMLLLFNVEAIDLVEELGPTSPRSRVWLRSGKTADVSQSPDMIRELTSISTLKAALV